MHLETQQYHAALSSGDRAICERLAEQIDRSLPTAENKIWHGHPVWFLEGNPIVGYSALKGGVRLLFWSGQSFAAPGLTREGRFKAAEKRYTSVEQVDAEVLVRWLAEAREVQWDYKNIVRRKGRLERLESPATPLSPPPAERATPELPPSPRRPTAAPSRRTRASRA